jgi:hypothetical protein
MRVPTDPNNFEVLTAITIKFDNISKLTVMPRTRMKNNKQLSSPEYRFLRYIPIYRPQKAIIKLSNEIPSKESFSGLFIKVSNIIFKSMFFYMKDNAYYASITRRSCINYRF